MLRVIETREYQVQIGVAEVARHRFAKHTTKVDAKGEIASFVELRRVKAGPPSVNPTAVHGAAYDKHDIGVAVVGSPISILTGGASKL